jgi:AcrB/AcrD/AcrF family
MPFSKYVVDPAHIETMRSAFRNVCDALQLNCDASDPMTEIIVMKIVEPAKGGELDPGRLRLRRFRVRAEVAWQLRFNPSASIFQEPPIPQIAIEVDRAATARYGINVSDVTNLQTGIGGGAVTQVYVGDRVYNVTVRFPTNARNNVEAIGALTLAAPGGAQVCAGCEDHDAQWREHYHARNEPPQPNHTDRLGRPRPRVLSRGSAGPDRAVREVRQDQVPPSLCRAIREPAARPGTTCPHSRPRDRADDASAVRRVRTATPSRDDPLRGAAGDAGRSDQARPSMWRRRSASSRCSASRFRTASSWWPTSTACARPVSRFATRS